MTTVTSINPNIGSVLGGTLITIIGTGFSVTPILNMVTIDGNVATVIFSNTTTIIASTPPHAIQGTYNIIVNSLITTFLFTYVSSITGVFPDAGPISGGTLITIIGIDFSVAPTVKMIFTVYPSVMYSCTNVTFLNNNTLLALTPPVSDPGSYDVSVDAGTAVSAFTYLIPPIISIITPNHGPEEGGTPITIVGFDFFDITSVTIGGNVATNILVNIDTITSPYITTITCITPPGTGTSIVEVIGVGGIGVSTFTYDTPAATITSINPPSGPLVGGTPITIIGTGFINVPSSTPIGVTIDGTTATSIFVSPDNTTITAITPAATATGPQIVEVTTTGGPVTTTYTYFTPIITSVYPTRGPTAGGTQITLTGNYLELAISNPTSVEIGGNPVGVTVVSNTKIIAIIPAGTGTQNIIVTFDTNINITASIPFTYDDTPIITLINPNGGPEEGGTQITITGTSFGITTTVTIGGISVAPISISPDMATIICITPPGIGRQPVVVTSVGSATSYFTYLPPLPPPPYGEQICVEPPYNATNFTSANSTVLSTLQSYAKNQPNYPWDTGTDAQQIYRSQQNTSYFNTLNQKTDVIKTANNVRIANGLPGNMPYPPFKSQAERLMYIQGLSLTSARNKITGENPSAPAGVPCTTIYEIINS